MIFPYFRPETPPPVPEVRDRSGSVRDRTQSIEDQITNSQEGEVGGGSQRSNILSRISKMGQSMLPAGASPGAGSGVSEEDMVSGGREGGRGGRGREGGRGRDGEERGQRGGGGERGGRREGGRGQRGGREERGREEGREGGRGKMEVILGCKDSVCVFFCSFVASTCIMQMHFEHATEIYGL